MPMPPFKLIAIDHVVLRIADLTPSLAFYVDGLGCTVEKVQDDLGLTQLRAGASLIDLVPLTGKLGRAGGAAPGREGRNVDHFALDIEPFDEAAIRAHLQAHGIAIGESGRRYGAKGYGPSIYVTDPDGNVVELKGPAS
ncbi:MAG: VOC family protein [Alphaproteobacteria bacterium]|nr:VOC family protein [Alphaproteobacteria bacterium]